MAKKKTKADIAFSSEAVVGVLQKKYGKDYGNIGKSGNEVFDDLKDLASIPVSPSLDLILGGGFREGSWVQLIGEPKCGKTTTALQFASNAQKEEHGGRHIYYVDVEGRMSLKNIEGINGLNLDKISRISAENGIMCAEDYLDIIIQLIKDHPQCVIILDSVSSLIASRDLEKKVDGAYRPGLPRILSDFTKKLTTIVPKQKVTVILITHYIADLSNSRRTKTADGGIKIQYQADTSMEVKYVQGWEEKSKQIGQLIHWNLKTSALGGFPGSSAVGYLRYGFGLDHIQELFNMANEVDLISAAGAWYTFEYLFDHVEEIRASLEEKGYDLSDDKISSTLKFQGAGACREFMVQNPIVVDILRKELTFDES